MNEVRESQGVLAPIVKSVSVDLPVETAFNLFSDQMNRWWPFATHSVGGQDTESCVLEGGVGGRFYEVLKDGSESDWGQVLAWEPPHRLAFTLHPGRTADFATQVEVTFRAEGERTLVTLVHQGWERCRELLGDAALAEREGYAGGWEHILRQFGVYSSNKNVGSA